MVCRVCFEEFQRHNEYVEYVKTQQTLHYNLGELGAEDIGTEAELEEFVEKL